MSCSLFEDDGFEDDGASAMSMSLIAEVGMTGAAVVAMAVGLGALVPQPLHLAVGRAEVLLRHVQLARLLLELGVRLELRLVHVLLAEPPARQRVLAARVARVARGDVTAAAADASPAEWVHPSIAVEPAHHCCHCFQAVRLTSARAQPTRRGQHA